MIYTQILLLTALVCLFLFSVYKLSKQLKNLFSERIENNLKNAISNRYAVAFGSAVATTLVQSSSLISVLTVTFVQARILPLTAAFAIIIGSNVGTTLSASLATLDLSILAPLTLLSDFLFQFAKGVLKKYSKALFYLGLLLLTLDLISQTALTIASEAWIKDTILQFSNPFWVYLSVCYSPYLFNPHQQLQYSRLY